MKVLDKEIILRLARDKYALVHPDARDVSDAAILAHFRSRAALQAGVLKQVVCPDALKRMAILQGRRTAC